MHPGLKVLDHEKLGLTNAQIKWAAVFKDIKLLFAEMLYKCVIPASYTRYCFKLSSIVNSTFLLYGDEWIFLEKNPAQNLLAYS